LSPHHTLNNYRVPDTAPHLSFVFCVSLGRGIVVCARLFSIDVGDRPGLLLSK